MHNFRNVFLIVSYLVTFILPIFVSGVYYPPQRIDYFKPIIYIPTETKPTTTRTTPAPTTTRTLPTTTRTRPTTTRTIPTTTIKTTRYIRPTVAQPVNIDLNFFGEFEAARVPFFGQALRFFQEMNDDVDSYEYQIGYKGQRVPKFCALKPCPTFKTLCQNSFYEVRRYAPLVLVSYTLKGQDYLSSGNNVGFQKLFAYLGGKNNQYIKIPVPTPFVVTTPVVLNAVDQFNNLIDNGEALSYYVPLPAEFYDYPPIPLDPDVKLIYLKKPRTVFISKFAGLATTSVWGSKIKIFQKVLIMKGHNVTKPYASLYNVDSSFLNRHNEIIFEVQDDDDQRPTPKSDGDDQGLHDRYKRNHDRDDDFYC